MAISPPGFAAPPSIETRSWPCPSCAFDCKYAYDGDNLVEETNATGAVVARYSQTQNIDEPLAMLRGATTSYYHSDGLGPVSSLSSSAGAIANTYTYDSFGKLTASTGSLTNSLRYTARESDTETGLFTIAVLRQNSAQP